jgi:hypothetical protein
MSAASGVLRGSRKQAKDRADGQCEVFVQVSERWRRCPGWGDLIVYLLPPERGGKHLDKAWEDHHLLVCCKIHARRFEECPDDPELARLSIQGEVAWVDRRPVYHGPDPYLSERYGAS